ncbi:hypothetical protein F511_27262 [Dorcoceras hygrometricum]|uniref:Uncharacterized protein n=1 Tax=Dorcoceras hygrometricum TaxID=472368 RepID=A0A2Z7CJU0_9LAMI|nr:hypothetical protein F511_27262 [Dorcoceras hygrometricum]
MSGSKQGFWGVLARKAKAVLDDDKVVQPHETARGTTVQTSDRTKKGQYHNGYNSPESHQKTDNPSLHKGLNRIASSLNFIGGTIGNALEAVSNQEGIQKLSHGITSFRAYTKNEQKIPSI